MVKSKRAREAADSVAETQPAADLNGSSAPQDKSEQKLKKRKRDTEDVNGAENGSASAEKKSKKDKKDKKKHDKESRKEKKDKRKNLQDLPEEVMEDAEEDAAEQTPSKTEEDNAEARTKEEKRARKLAKREEKKQRKETEQGTTAATSKSNDMHQPQQLRPPPRQNQRTTRSTSVSPQKMPLRTRKTATSSSWVTCPSAPQQQASQPISRPFHLWQCDACATATTPIPAAVLRLLSLVRFGIRGLASTSSTIPHLTTV